MQPPTHVTSHLDDLQLRPNTIYYNLKPPRLYEEALDRDEGRLAAGGSLVTRTPPHTGRSPKDRFIVRDAAVADTINWGEVNQPTDRGTFNHFHERMAEHAAGRDLFVQDLYAGWDETHRLPVRIISEKAWHSLFARNMFVRPDGPVPASFEPGFTVVDLCEFDANPARDGTHSEAAIFVDIGQDLILIGGTHYGGEIKKSIFSVLNYLLPDEGVLPMHCSANEDAESTAVFFGLSGTGKTTLSADASRTLIGDDELGWSDRGVYNFEGGCYAKMIDITPESEPEIYGTTDEFGTILENVIVDPETRKPDFSDATITQNTRGSYPLSYIPNAAADGQGGHPNHILFLTYDAFGVLPPVSELTPAQAMYHFLSGYTAKVAGTEAGVTEPKATFSTCFGEPFMVRDPSVYADLLGQKIRRHDARCWLVNTGMTGGPHGVGHRIDLEHTRALVDAILDGTLRHTPRTTEPVFDLSVPDAVPEVPDTILTPRQTWDDTRSFDQHARTLVNAFAENFAAYADAVDAEVRAAGPTPEAVHG